MPTPHGAKADDFTEWKRSVERRLRQALARTATRPQLSLDSGGFDVTGNGQVRIFGSGGLKLISPDDVEIFSSAGWGSPYEEPDGDPQPMIQIRRTDGVGVFFMGDPFPGFDGYQQFWAFYDHEGTIIVGDDILSGRGLARPYGPMTVTSSKDDVTPVSTAAFAEVHVIAGEVQNPRLEVPLTVTAPGTGAGEVQIVHLGSGTIVAGPTAVPTGTSIAPFYEFDVPLSVPMFTHQYFSVQTRRTSGTGNITSRVWNANGMQT